MSKPVSRREFLNLLGVYGGTSAVLQAGAALGLLPATSRAADLSLRNVSGNGNPGN